MNETILSSIQQHALAPEAVQQATRISERDDVREQQDALAKERQDTERRIARLVAVIADGGDAASLVASVRELENRVKAIDVEMRGLQPVPRLAPQVVENRLAEWRRLLRQSVTQAGPSCSAYCKAGLCSCLGSPAMATTSAATPVLTSCLLASWSNVRPTSARVRFQFFQPKIRTMRITARYLNNFTNE